LQLSVAGGIEKVVLSARDCSAQEMVAAVMASSEALHGRIAATLYGGWHMHGGGPAMSAG
jgi:hypothetical protein